MSAVGGIVSERLFGKVKSKKTRHYALSKCFNAGEVAKIARNRWGMENSPHGILDAVFREDECRVWAGFAAESFVTLRYMALNLLKQGTRSKRGAKTRRKAVGGDASHLLEPLKGNFQALVLL
ncbi:MAG: hypothetical protein LBU23_10225 [Planctomycetota bacterium]|nr:hypothetical protein [Planctomycetota bacterium]